MSSHDVPYESYLSLIRQLDELIEVLANHPDPATRDQVASLLTGLDMLHHEALGRLVATVHGSGASDFLHRALQDPIVKTLLGLYGLAELDLPEESQPEPAASTTFVPLERLTVNGQPLRPKASWVEVARTEQLPPDTLLSVQVEEIPVLLLNSEGEIFGYRDSCPQCEQPLGSGSLEGPELSCPTQGCRFDARTGRRRDAGKGRLQVLPVAVRGSSIALARQDGSAAQPEGPSSPRKEVA